MNNSRTAAPLELLMLLEFLGQFNKRGYTFIKKGVDNFEKEHMKYWKNSDLPLV